jgi:hypothetical protein
VAILFLGLFAYMIAEIRATGISFYPPLSIWIV